MADRITLEEALKLVELGNCHMVKGNCNFVVGTVHETINNRNWQYVETPKERFERLLEKTENKELIEAFKQLENNND